MVDLRDALRLAAELRETSPATADYFAAHSGDAAATDRSISSVVVVSHVPPRDPTPQAASQLADRLEAALLVESRVLRSAPVLRRVALQEQRLVPVQ